MAQLKSTNIIGNLSVTGLSKATDFKGITAELSGEVSATDFKGATAELSGAVSIGGETNIDNVLSAKKLLIKNNNSVTIGHTYTGTNYLELVLGNSTATSATNGTQGYLYLYGTGTNWTKFVSGNPTANNTLTLPTASGTIALTSNIPGAEKGITLANGKYGHSNTAITAGSVGSAQSPSHGGTFTIPKITYDAYGHITGATTVNITLPADNNTDTKVTQEVQTASSYTNWRPLIVGSSNSSTEGFTPTTVTDKTYVFNTISVQPSSGTIRATAFKGITLSVAKSITITNTNEAIGHLNFSRPSYNYITAPAEGTIAFDISGTGGGSSAPCGLIITKNADDSTLHEIIPGTTKKGNLGTSAKQWNSIYANNIVLSSTTNGSQTAASTPALRIGSSDSAIHLIMDRDAINAKATSTTAGTLKINESGGQVVIGPGGLSVTGNAILGNSASEDTHKVNGHMTFNGIAYFANGTTYYINNSGTAYLNTITANGALNAKTTLTVTGATTLNGTLTANNTATFAKDVSITSTTASTSMTTGALKVSGGVGVAGQLNAKTVRVDNSVYFQYNSTNECLDVIFG